MNSANEPDKQGIDQLKQRYEQLRDRKIQAKTQLEASRKQLEDLKKEARELYGVDDLDTLRAKLDEMTRENERRRAEYQRHLDDIETKLKGVEDAYQKQLNEINP